MAHHPCIENEIAEQHAHREYKQRRIGSHHAGCRIGEIVEIHGGRDKTVKKGHDDAGDGGQHNALAAVALHAARLAGRGHSVEHNGNDDERNAEKKNHGITFRSPHIIDNHPQHQSQPHAQRKSYGQTGQRYRSGQQNIRSIENHAAQQHTADAAPVCLSEIGDETAAFAAEASERESGQDAEQQHADHIVPIEKFVTPAFRSQFLRVSPRTPTEHRHETKHDGQCIIIYNKH